MVWSGVLTSRKLPGGSGGGGGGSLKIDQVYEEKMIGQAKLTYDELTTAVI